jgi:putative transposase
MKLTLKIKLLPTKEQKELLLLTMKESNSACNSISEIAFSKRLFNQFKLHKETYYHIKNNFNLSAQMAVRCIGKVTDSYKLDKKTKRTFKEFGSIPYDSRIMTYKPNNIVSLWCIGGRQNFKFVCHNLNYLPYIQGEADLVYKKDKFYLLQTVEVPEEEIKDIEDFIGWTFDNVKSADLSGWTKFS